MQIQRMQKERIELLSKASRGKLSLDHLLSIRDQILEGGGDVHLVKSFSICVEMNKVKFSGKACCPIVCFGLQLCTLISDFGEVEITVAFPVNHDQHEVRGAYTGEVKDGRRNDGWGTYVFSDGGRYEGEYQRDLRNGQGKFFTANGALKYEGGWKDGRRHGRGTMYYNDGSRNVGEFRDSYNYIFGKIYHTNG